MSIPINKSFLSLCIILVLMLVTGIRAIDVAQQSRPTVETNGEENHSDSIHDMAKRRFLPTRRELYEYINSHNNDNTEEDESHLNAKRYFLKSKRYFLHSKRYFLDSKRDPERRDED